MLNFRSCITLRIFADFIFVVVDQIKFIFHFKMFELESCIHRFHVYYVSWTPREGDVLHCTREIANRENPYAVAVDILLKFRMNKIFESWVNAIFKPTQNLSSSVLL